MSNEVPDKVWVQRYAAGVGFSAESSSCERLFELYAALKEHFSGEKGYAADGKGEANDSRPRKMSSSR
jgi:hypothetical protein